MAQGPHIHPPMPSIRHRPNHSVERGVFVVLRPAASGPVGDTHFPS